MVDHDIVFHDKMVALISPLSEFIDTIDVYDARLRQIQVPILDEGNEETALWVSIQEQQFKIRNAWKDMNCNDTKDKLLIWRPNDDLKCALCNKCPDTHNHLFFTCEFSNEIWNELLRMLNVRLSRCWDKIINEVKALELNKNIWSIMRRLVCGAAVFYIWQERNNRLFKNEKRDSNTILNIVKEIVKMKLIGIKVKESRIVKEVEERWNDKMQRGALHNIISYRDVYNARIRAGMTVSELNGAWNWLVEWAKKYPMIGIMQNVTLDSNKKDYMAWRSRDGKEGKFYVKRAYKHLHEDDSIVGWCKLIWFS
ncbi:RNA-directed DNA polymerase, eukaryota, reverse transcriptase zinc-binding domain protein [Tanacetum coccineum]